MCFTRISRILQAKQRCAAIAILCFAAVCIGKEDEYDGRLGDESLPECSLRQQSLRFRIRDDDDPIGLQVPGRRRKLRRRKDRVDLLLFNKARIERRRSMTSKNYMAHARCRTTTQEINHRSSGGLMDINRPPHRTSCN
jgi:hypothetical protein